MKKNTYVPRAISNYFEYLNPSSKLFKVEPGYSNSYNNYKHFVDNKISIIWKEVIPELTKEQGYMFSVNFNYRKAPFTLNNISKDSKEFIEKVKISNQILNGNVDKLFKITPELVDYIKNTEYFEWNLPHPEDLVLYDTYGAKVFSSISHENILIFYLTMTEKDKLNKKYELDLIENIMFDNPTSK